MFPSRRELLHDPLNLERGVLSLLVELVGEVPQHGPRDDGERIGGHRRTIRPGDPPLPPPLQPPDRRRSPHRPPPAPTTPATATQP
uniref:Uncharacterized protein n=1 Tax=Arundo donax TaxID=35708 RepID=A0A0A9HG30_ARUDO